MEELSQLTFNRGLIEDASAFAEEASAASWLFLCGDEFGDMEGGLAFDAVQAAVPIAAQVPADPPRELDLDLARRLMTELDELPRPTLVTCRTGPRSSAVVYLYAGLKSGAPVDEVLARADADEAPFAGDDDLRTFVRRGIEELR